ncbi:hypothetical protein [Prosthecobacter sp.]|uniref:hypothetical protein n=1 Tax=Prosthecobacter sp. TaxID=1965333 RepID=UPI0037845792
MNQMTRSFAGFSTAIALFFTTSCAELQQVANDLGAGGSMAAGAGIGGLVGGLTGGHGKFSGRNAAIGALAGVALGLAFHYIAKANVEQKQIAADKGRNAVANRTVRNKIQNGQARKAAVVVPPKDGNKGGIMKVDPNTGKPESDKIYQPKAGSSLSTGDVIKLDGTPCALYGSYSQGM